jgi:putative DNA primase/helicase
MTDFAFASVPTVEELARFDLNDDGNAQRFIRMAGGRIDADTGEIEDLSACTVLHLRRRGWIVFNGQFWDLETGEARARRHAIKVARAMQAQMALRVTQAKADFPLISAKALQSIRDFGVQAGNNGRIGSMMAVAASYLDVDADEFDQDPMALNCANGVVRFERKDGLAVARFVRGHRPQDRFTRMTVGDYDPAAPAPVFDGVLRFAMPQDDDRRYLHKALGYCATGSTAEQKFFVFQGKGGDSKSTVVNAVRHALGTYATTAAIETFLDSGVKRGSEASPDIAALAGDSRMICAGEPPSGSKLATGAIKQFTGGGKIKARELREGLFEFTPVGKVIIECNRKPTINDTDNGIWRRLKILPWRVQVPLDRIDGHLPGKLEREADGILAWLVEGVLAWMEDGLADVASVAEALEDYRKGSNPFVQWFEDRVERDPEARIGATILFKDYAAWMEDQGHERPMSQKAFGGALGDLQIVLAGKDGEGRMTRRGARLRGRFAPLNPTSGAGSSGPGPGGSVDASRFDDVPDFEADA